MYLGDITGSLVKQTEFPMLIVPAGCKFKPFNTVLLSIRSGLINKADVLKPLIDIVGIFKMKVNLLHVITPENTEVDNSLHQDFVTISNTISKSEMQLFIRVYRIPKGS